MNHQTNSHDPIRVAIVDEEFPYPANSGKRLRTLNLIQRLANSHRLTYVAHRNAKPGESEVARAYLESKGIETIEVDRAVPSQSGLVFYARLGANIFSPLPYSVAVHSSQKMKQVLQDLERKRQIDLWHCEWTPYAELFRNWNTHPLVIAAHNVESLIWQRYWQTESNLLKRWYIRKQWEKFRRFEKWAFSRATRTIAVSHPDRSLAIKEFEADNVDVVENGVDTKAYKSDGKRQTNRMIFLGSLDWRPNLDGLEQFINSCLPQVISTNPAVVFQIVGRNPASWLVELARRHPNIELHADVPNVIPYLSKATVMVVPLRVGGGSRLKIIEAAANGLPVVSTCVGAEGLSFEKDGEHIFTVERIDEMAEPILDVLCNKEASTNMANRARQTAVEQYDWEMLTQRQAEVWRKAVHSRDRDQAAQADLQTTAENLAVDTAIGSGF